MMTLALQCVLAATVFVEQSVDGLRFTTPDPLVGSFESNFRREDFDGDGASDLLFPDRVVFQHDGTFPAGATADLAPEMSGALCDVFAGAVYACRAGELQVLSWERNGWQVVHRQAVDWPGSVTSQLGQADEGAPAQLGRFLTDLDGDRVPELVFYSRAGLHVYRRSAGSQDFVGGEAHPILPEFSTGAARGQVLWPAEERVLTTPARRLELDLVWRDETLHVISRQELRNGLARFRMRAFSFDALDFRRGETREYPPMPGHLRPVHLNADGALDFAGGAPALASASAFPTPIYEVVASTDGGETLQRFKSKAYMPRCSFVDVEGDGDLDIVVEETEVTGGGVRESLNRFFFQRVIHHSVAVRLQEADGTFSSDATMRRSVPIYLERVPYREGPMFRRYKAGDLVDVTGDFNGDGLKDILLQDRSDRLVVYLSRAYRFSKHPTHFLEIDPLERFYVVDIDANGYSDVVLIRPDEESGGERSRVFLSRETGS